MLPYLAIVSSAAVHMDVHISFQDTNFIYLGLYPKVELVDHMVIPFFWPHPQHVEVPGLGIELEPQQ